MIARTLIALMIGLIPLTSFAQVTIKLNRDVDVIIVNGEEQPLSLISKRQLVLPNGQNQLLIQVSKLIENRSDYMKFRSNPLVLTFEASDTSLDLRPTREIRTVSQIENFKTTPSFYLTTNSGAEITTRQDVLPASSRFNRDYEKDLAKYNKQKGIKIDFLQVDARSATSVQSNNAASGRSPENELILMKADFLRLKQENKQAFVKWALNEVKKK